MSRHLARPRIGRIYLVAVFLVLAVFQVQARATPGSYHTAVGSGTSWEPGACTGQFVCRPEHAGDTFSINASDKTGSYGSMSFNGVAIPLTCITIQDTTDGHTLYASGTGSNGAKYYATVTAPKCQPLATKNPAGVSTWLISTNAATANPCGAASGYQSNGPGSFTIAPM